MGGGWSTPRPYRYTPGEIYPVRIVQEAGWTPGPVWTGAENLALTGIRFPDRPARSELLHRAIHGQQIARNAFLSSLWRTGNTMLSLRAYYYCYHHPIPPPSTSARFRAMASPFLGFRDNRVYTIWGSQPHAQPSTWRVRVFLFLAPPSKRSQQGHPHQQLGCRRRSFWVRWCMQAPSPG